MDRLTIKTEYGKHLMPSSNISIDGALAQKLGMLEDAEEQGRLVVLPCALGSTVYNINTTRNTVLEMMVTAVKLYHDTRGFNYYWKTAKEGTIYQNIVGFNSCELGTTVFLTKEEAESALKAVQDNE